MAKEYYELLGVSEDASQEEIKKSYRKKAKKYHPDSNKDTADEDKFKKINKAYDVLSDEEKRKKYDQFGKAGVEGSARQGQRRAASNFQDIFEQIFGGGGQRRRREERGQNLKIPLTITLEEAYKGVEKTYEVERKQKCKECDGTGGQNKETKECEKCNGRGRVQEVQRSLFGRQKVVKECEKCNGRGKIPKTPCKECKGDGVTEVKEKINFEIPKGVRDNQRIRIQGKGHENRKGKSGDLYIFITVEEHDFLERRGDDLYTTLQIGVGDAALGSKAQVPHLEEDLEVKIPSQTQPGQVLRVSKKGMPDSRNRYGDLYIKIDVEIPEIKEEDKEVFEEYRKEDSIQDKTFFERVKDFVQ